MVTIANAPLLTCGLCGGSTHTLVVRAGAEYRLCPACYKGEHFIRHYGRPCASELA